MKTHNCTLGYYGNAPVGVHPSWDGELFTEQAAQETVNIVEAKRIEEPDRQIETPFGLCTSVRAYLESGRIIWQLAEVQS